MSDTQKTLDHLPVRQRREIETARDAVLAAIEEECKSARPAERRQWRVVRVVLYGSFARGDWFDDKVTGRASDIDLLVIVNRKDFKKKTRIWLGVQNRLLDDPKINSFVSLIVHTHGEVRDALLESQYFFTEIIKDGVPLHIAEEFAKDGALRYALPKPEKPSPQRAYEIARDYHAEWKETAEGHFSGGVWQKEQGRLKIAAFNLHQAAESAYRLVTLTAKHYAPATHDLVSLRNAAEKFDERLTAAWPDRTDEDRERFKLLNRAYTGARYDPDYVTSEEILNWQIARVEKLIQLTDKTATARVKGWKAAADKAG